MAHFAKLDDNNVVIDVVVVNNDVLDSSNEETSGVAFLTEWSNGYSNWKQTSYNKTFRKNFAGIGMYYDATYNAFIAQKYFDSWVLNEETCIWEPPIPYPTDDKLYKWDESTLSWIEAK